MPIPLAIAAATSLPHGWFGQNGRMRFVLASTSPARLALLRAAGLEPETLAPGVAEDELVAAVEAERGSALGAAELVQLLAEAKAEAAAPALATGDTATTAASGSGHLGHPSPMRADLRSAEPTLLFGGDSAFEINGQVHGKPHTPERARARWLAQSGQSGTLWSGHCLLLLSPDAPPRRVGRVASATVAFAELSEREIDAYIASGEPLEVAGAFTIDSLGGPFIRRVEGDPSTVVGLSLSTLRDLVRELDVEWTSLWATPRS